MSLLAAGAEGGEGTIMALLGLALALVPKFNCSNIPLAEWEERLESAACLYQVPAWLIAELAIYSLEDDAHQVVKALLEKVRPTQEQIVVCLEKLCCPRVEAQILCPEATEG